MPIKHQPATSAPNSTSTPQLPITLPEVSVIQCNDKLLPERKDIIKQKQNLKSRRAVHSEAYRKKNLTPVEHERLISDVKDCIAQEDTLENELQTCFVPMHSANIFLNPRMFFVTQLFRVASNSEERVPRIELTIGQDEHGPILYVGPELRQREGLVFLALINMARDVRTGVSVSFSPRELCNVLFQRYDGPTRTRLKTLIWHLQEGHIRTKTYSVQLAQRFNHPATGNWSVALDKDVVKLFQYNNVWLDVTTRIRISEGLSSWLLGYVEAQTRLIPTSVENLKSCCGSSSEGRSFLTSLRKSLNELVILNIIDSGFRIAKGILYWRKVAPLSQIKYSPN